MILILGFRLIPWPLAGLNGDWGTDTQLTNYTILYPNDANPGLKTNWYIGQYSTTGYLPVSFDWKFRVNDLDGGYELPVSTSGGNRVTTLTNQSETIGPIAYDDLGLGDLTLSNVTATFTLYMTNGTPDSTGYAYEQGVDSIYVNGPWAPSGGWDGGRALPASQQLVEVGSSDVLHEFMGLPQGQFNLCDLQV